MRLACVHICMPSGLDHRPSSAILAKSRVSRVESSIHHPPLKYTIGAPVNSMPSGSIRSNRGAWVGRAFVVGAESCIGRPLNLPPIDQYVTDDRLSRRGKQFLECGWILHTAESMWCAFDRPLQTHTVRFLDRTSQVLAHQKSCLSSSTLLHTGVRIVSGGQRGRIESSTARVLGGVIDNPMVLSVCWSRTAQRRVRVNRLTLADQNPIPWL